MELFSFPHKPGDPEPVFIEHDAGDGGKCTRCQRAVPRGKYGQRQVFQIRHIALISFTPPSFVPCTDISVNLSDLEEITNTIQPDVVFDE